MQTDGLHRCHIDWSKEEYTLASFKDKKLPLPAIVLVTCGHRGRDENETYSCRDMLVLYEWKTQERVLAKAQNVTISIPLDFQCKLQLVQDRLESEYILADIVKNFKPPLLACFQQNINFSFNIKHRKAYANDLGNFTLMSSHVLDYVTASSVVKGKIDTEYLLSLPLHRQIRFVVANTLNKGPIEDYSEFLCSSLSYKEYENTSGVLDYTELLNTVEDYDYIRIVTRGAWGRKDEDDKTNNDYEPLTPTVTDNFYLKVHQNYPPGRDSSSRRLKSSVFHVPEMSLIQKPIAQVSPRGLSKPTENIVPAPQVGAVGIGLGLLHGTPDLLQALQVRRQKVEGQSQSQALVSTGVPTPPVLPRNIAANEIKKLKFRLAPVPPVSPLGQALTSTPPIPTTFDSLTDVPLDISELSVDQICQCLELLNMGKFTSQFREEKIDGCLLKTCTARDLKEEYDMSHLSAKRLIMFANEGWRPKEY